MHIRFAFILSILLMGNCFVSCKKDDTTNPIVEPQNAKQSDQSGNAAIDSGIEDVNDIINNRIGGGSNARTAAYNLPCGVVSLDTSQTNTQGQRIYQVNYGTKTKCGFKYKSGIIEFQLVSGKTFAEVGAVYAATFKEYEVEIRATGDVVKINGTVYSTNVDGGYIWQVITQSKVIKHKERGTLTITYVNGESRLRNYYHLKTWSTTGSWAGLSFEMAGDTLINGEAVSETGKTYQGNYNFKTTVSQPLKWSNCGSDYAGPYVLKMGHARMNIEVPQVTPAYIDVEAGHNYDLTKPNATNTLVQDCNANAYKITTVIGASSTNTFQLY